MDLTQVISAVEACGKRYSRQLGISLLKKSNPSLADMANFRHVELNFHPNPLHTMIVNVFERLS